MAGNIESEFFQCCYIGFAATGGSIIPFLPPPKYQGMSQELHLANLTDPSLLGFCSCSLHLLFQRFGVTAPHGVKQLCSTYSTHMVWNNAAIGSNGCLCLVLVVLPRPAWDMLQQRGWSSRSEYSKQHTTAEGQAFAADYIQIYQIPNQSKFLDAFRIAVFSN